MPSNLAEGYGRGGRDYERFVGLAYGSLLELETQIELASRLAIGEAPGQAAALLRRTASVGRQLNALRSALRRHRTGADS